MDIFPDGRTAKSSNRSSFRSGRDPIHGASGKNPSSCRLSEPHEEDEEVAPHDGQDEPDAHPEPDPLVEKEGRPQEADQADEPEEDPRPQGSQEITLVYRVGIDPS